MKIIFLFAEIKSVQVKLKYPNMIAQVEPFILVVVLAVTS